LAIGWLGHWYNKFKFNFTAAGVFSVGKLLHHSITITTCFFTHQFHYIAFFQILPNPIQSKGIIWMNEWGEWMAAFGTHTHATQTAAKVAWSSHRSSASFNQWPLAILARLTLYASPKKYTTHLFSLSLVLVKKQFYVTTQIQVCFGGVSHTRNCYSAHYFHYFLLLRSLRNKY
jgi:hypothetical protein